MEPCGGSRTGRGSNSGAARSIAAHITFSAPGNCRERGGARLLGPLQSRAEQTTFFVLLPLESRPYREVRWAARAGQIIGGPSRWHAIRASDQLIRGPGLKSGIIVVVLLAVGVDTIVVNAVVDPIIGINAVVRGISLVVRFGVWVHASRILLLILLIVAGLYRLHGRARGTGWRCVRDWRGVFPVGGVVLAAGGGVLTVVA